MTALPCGWSVRTVKDLLPIRYGKSLTANLRMADGKYPVVGSAGEMARTDESLINGPTIIVGRKGNVGAVQLLTEGGWPIDTTYYSEVPVELDPRFVTHQLIALRLVRLDSSTATPSLRRQDYEAQELVVPPLGEQRLIVDILEDHLSRLDAADQLLTAAHRRSELLRAVTLESLAPKSTALRNLGQLATDSGYGTSTKCIVDGPGVPVVRIPNLIGGRIDLADEKRVADATVDLIRLMLDTDDLLIVRTNGSRDLIGRGAVVQSGVFASFASYLIRFRLDPSQVRPQWTRVMLGTPSVRRVLEAMAASSAGQYNLGLKKLNGVTIPCPPIEEQDRLLARFDEQEWALGSLTRSLAEGRVEAQSLRRSLLAAAFSGRLSGHSSDMEMAEEMAGV